MISYHSDIIRQSGLMAVYGSIVKRCLRRADKIVVATPRHLEFSPWLLRHREKVIVIPYGIDSARFEKPETAPVSFNNSARPILLTVGRLVGYKGHRYLLEAMKNLNATLWICGGGPLEAELRAQAAALGVNDRVQFLGNVDDSELPALYQQCDIFILPSITPNEAFGMVQIEAMACGKPVISCDLKSGVPWVNQHEVTGLVVPPADSLALASAVERLQRNPAEAAAFGESGRRRVSAEFSERRMMDDYYQLFGSLSE